MQKHATTFMNGHAGAEQSIKGSPTGMQRQPRVGLGGKNQCDPNAACDCGFQCDE